MDGITAPPLAYPPEVIVYIRLLQERGIVDRSVVLVEKIPLPGTTRDPEEE